MRVCSATMDRCVIGVESRQSGVAVRNRKERDRQKHKHGEGRVAGAPCGAVLSPAVVAHVVVTVLDHPVAPQESVDHLRICLPGREVRRGIADGYRLLHHLAPAQFLHVRGDLGHLTKTWELRIPTAQRPALRVQYLACAAGALRQTAVALLDGAALVSDGSAGLEAHPRFFEEVRHVVLIFTR